MKDSYKRLEKTLYSIKYMVILKMMIKNIRKSDESRKKCYALIINRSCSDRNNYELYLDASNDVAAIIIIKAKKIMKNM